MMEMDNHESYSDSSDDSSDHERLAIREELKSMTFEDLLQLKQKFGTKSYDSHVFKSKSAIAKSANDKPLRKEFNRTNKNRPREESSKAPVKSLFHVSNKKEEIRARDPRFDSLCGEYNETAFTRNYEFVNKIKEKELNTLKNLHMKEKDPEEKARIKLALDRMVNQKRSRQVRDAKSSVNRSERVKNLKLIKEGQKPHFKRKGEKKALDLIEKYEKLKADGKLEKYVKKKNKQQSYKSSFK